MTFKQHKNEGIVPPEAEKDESATEIARVWAADGKQQLVLRIMPTTFWRDPVVWGLLLVDLAKHGANSYQLNNDRHPLAEILARIKEGFDTEWETPNPNNRGGQTYIVVGLDKGSLNIPPKAEKDERAVELVRIWESDSREHFFLRIGLWDDPFIWGAMLADLAEHVAKGYAKVSGQSVVRALARIKEGFDAEWASSTYTFTGKLVPPE